MSFARVADRRRRARRASGLLSLVALAVLLLVPSFPPEAKADAPSSAVEAEGTESGEANRQALLRRALERYARALSETDRDARLADFASAERNFAALAAEGVNTPALWTNLGNAALQAQHPGRALVAYHRALALDPDDAKARQNMNHVRSGLPAWIPRPGAEEGAQRFSLSRIPKRTRRLAAGFAFLAMAVFVAAAVRRSQGAWRGLAILAGVAWLLALGSTFMDEDGRTRVLAVTTAEESFARSADSTLSSLAFPEPLPPGVEVEILENRADWVRARLANGRDVWLRESSVTAISAPPE